MLAVGRFAFLPMHRRDLEKSVAVSGPKTTGRNMPQFETGCYSCFISWGVLGTAPGIGAVAAWAGQLFLVQAAAGASSSPYKSPPCWPRSLQTAPAACSRFAVVLPRQSTRSLHALVGCGVLGLHMSSAASIFVALLTSSSSTSQRSLHWQCAQPSFADHMLCACAGLYLSVCPARNYSDSL